MRTHARPALAVPAIALALKFYIALIIHFHAHSRLCASYILLVLLCRTSYLITVMEESIKERPKKRGRYGRYLMDSDPLATIPRSTKERLGISDQPHKDPGMCSIILMTVSRGNMDGFGSRYTIIYLCM